MKKLYKRIYNLLFERAKKKRDQTAEDYDSWRYNHVFLVYDYVKKETLYWNISETDNDFPYLVENMIYEKLINTTDKDGGFTEEELRARYKLFYEQIDKALEERIGILKVTNR